MLMLLLDQAAGASSPTPARGPCAAVMGTCPPGSSSPQHSPKIDLGHPFATSVRIAHGPPLGEAALIKRTIYKEPGCGRGRGDN